MNTGQDAPLTVRQGCLTHGWRWYPAFAAASGWEAVANLADTTEPGTEGSTLQKLTKRAGKRVCPLVPQHLLDHFTPALAAASGSMALRALVMGASIHEATLVSFNAFKIMGKAALARGPI